jgi:hypothetical protein
VPGHAPLNRAHHALVQHLPQLRRHGQRRCRERLNTRGRDIRTHSVRGSSGGRERGEDIGAIGDITGVGLYVERQEHRSDARQRLVIGEKQTS